VKYRRRNASLRRKSERGYVLLTLLLMAALMMVLAAAVAPKLEEQITRDREEELIHRGMEYRRAIRAFVKHTGRFPTRLEELQDVNGVRYLRKQYKDPMTGKEFRLVHAEDISGYRLLPQSDTDQNGNNTGDSPDQAGRPDTATSATSDPSSQQQSVAQQASTEQPTPAPNSAANTGLRAVFGGYTGSSAPSGPGVIMGVASKSTKSTIREFEHKNHYNQWLFFYSPIYDGSVEVKGPTPTHPVFAKGTVDSSNPNSQSPGQSPGQTAPFTGQPLAPSSSPQVPPFQQ